MNDQHALPLEDLLVEVIQRLPEMSLDQLTQIGNAVKGTKKNKGLCAPSTLTSPYAPRQPRRTR